MKTSLCDFAGGDSKITAFSGTRARGLCQTVCRVGDCLHRASCVQGFSQCVHVYLTTSTTISFAYMRARICGHTNKHARASARDHTLIHIERRKHRPCINPIPRAERRRQAAFPATNTRGRYEISVNPETIAQRWYIGGIARRKGEGGRS